MIEVGRILCPVEFSEHSQHALAHAFAIARWYGGSVVALHVVPPVTTLVPNIGAPPYPPLVYTVEDIEQFRMALETFVLDEARKAGGVSVEAEVVEGSAAGTIVERARTLPADLVVMGTHGRSGFARLLLGAAAERVVRQSPCPVLTVPLQSADAATTGPIVYKRVLCAVDFSPSSDLALTYAASLAMEADARLSVLHVIEVAVPALEPVVMAGAAASAWDQVAQEMARRQLREAITDDVRTYSHVEEVVSKGKPYREILRVAGEERSDLIVMGVHGSVAGALAFGATTNHVVRAATCPVLTLRA